MKIAVLGAGAMGSLYGGMLAQSGENEVTLIDVWKDHIQAINSKGLTINAPDGAKNIGGLNGVNTAAEAGVVDLLIVFVKATMTEAAMSQAASVVGPNTMVLTLQNGLGNVEALCRVVDRGHVIAGTTSFGASIKGPGEINLAGIGGTVLGELDAPSSERLAALKDVFDRAGLKADISPNVMGLIWTKLLANIAINALATLLNLKNGQLLDHPESEALMEAAVNEAVAVAKAKGIGLDVSDPVSFATGVAKKTEANTCSMLQDVNAKRLTEIAVINGAVVAAGREVGIPTPVNLVLTNLITVIQNTYSK